jgi:hypothetical protein
LRRMDYGEWQNKATPYFLRLSDRVPSTFSSSTAMCLRAPIRVATDPQYFFSKNYHFQDTHKEGIEGHARYFSPPDMEEEMTFELLVEEKDMWLPPNEEEMVENKHWSSFPADTYVGWRGVISFTQQVGEGVHPVWT